MFKFFKYMVMKTFIALVVFLSVPALYAAEGGYTNYVPLYGDFGVAIPPDKPGWYFQNDFYYFEADGRELVPGYNAEVDIAVNLSTFFYK